MTERKQWWGWWEGGGEPEANNLVYTKTRKDIYAIRKHETTLFFNSSQHKQGRKYYALAASPLTASQNLYKTSYDRLDGFHTIYIALNVGHWVSEWWI